MQQAAATLRRFAAVVFSAAVVGGCALSEGYKYNTAPVAFRGIAASGLVSLVVQDARPYVVSGNKPEKFAGLLRGGYGNPFDVSTSTGNPLAVDIRDAIVRGLNASGVNVVTAVASPADPVTRVRSGLQATNARRHIHVTLHEWKTDSLINTSLYYDLTVAVLDGRGATLAERRIKGEDELGGTMGMGPEDRIVAGVGKRLNEIFADPQIVAALR